MENKSKDTKDSVTIEKKSTNHQTIGMSIGMCLGVSIGMTFGYGAFDNGPIGMCIGMAIGMCVGIALGKAKDDAVNKQFAEKGYAITEIKELEDGKNEVKFADREGNEQKVIVNKAEMKSEKFKVGDFIYLDEAGKIEQAFGEE